MNQAVLKPLIWIDYRLAILFTLILPIAMLIWALSRQSDAIVRLLIIYWRVASLLGIAVYLAIAEWSTPISYITGFVARVLIPISLWFWVDLNDEIKDLPQSSLKLALTSWRWAVTIYSILGAIVTLPFLPCTLSAGTAAVDDPFCRIWLQAPWGYRAFFHPNASPGFLGFVGAVGLVIYTLYFVYFLFVRLGKQGRSALEQ
jgi:Protein of unknown function (DUF3177)